MKLEIYPDEKLRDRFRWRLRVATGRIAAFSDDTFPNQKAARKAAYAFVSDLDEVIIA